MTNVKPVFSHINVAGSVVPISESVKLLGVILDKSITFQKHTNQVSQSYYHMKAFRHIRHCLDDKTASLIAHALISFRLDYANSLLLGSPNYVTNKLQCIQNSLARISKSIRSLSFVSFIGYLAKAEFVSSLPPLHTKRFLPTPHTTVLLLSTITNLSILFAPLTSLIFYPTPSSTNFGSRSFRCSASVI